ncbi:hypothetical protein LB524_14545 [Mesorhizobium sp. ESP6-5]|uniref:hypothetical protein n=1 Tax=unclassified Mesorhizobium TaxID=325217 RepID=UPI00112AA00D|nr:MULTISPECIES: hypothetical protein [unclassified Mesorhizobium]MBZ9756513.1 hypothetical protein [Mesorhizobium sp. ESP6-5]TPK19670.1 hypothetical protein FJ872_13120 [Mesorhizobium sp. B2-5-9]
MKKLLLASLIAVASAAATVAPADAWGLPGFGVGPFGGFGPFSGGAFYGAPFYDYGGRYYGPRYYGDYPSYMVRYPHRYSRHHYRRCRVKLLRHWHHHHRVLERVRICPY